jgi:hypothetical protein
MKMLFLATAACLLLSLSSGAHAQKAAFSDQYCVPYCTRFYADVIAGRKPPLRQLPDGTWQANPTKKVEDSPAYRERFMSKCMPMCRELGH